MLHQHTPNPMEVTTMPAHSLGERRPITTRVNPAILSLLDELRAEAGVGTMSQYVADILAEHVGRPDLVREIGRKESHLLSA